MSALESKVCRIAVPQADALMYPSTVRVALLGISRIRLFKYAGSKANA
jgi:hypothetical protein